MNSYHICVYCSVLSSTVQTLVPYIYIYISSRANVRSKNESWFAWSVKTDMIQTPIAPGNCHEVLLLTANPLTPLTAIQSSQAEVAHHYYNTSHSALSSTQNMLDVKKLPHVFLHFSFFFVEWDIWQEKVVHCGLYSLAFSMRLVLLIEEKCIC